MLDKALSIVQSAQGQTAVLAIVAEAALRLVKTDKPLSLAHVVAEGLHKVADLCAGLANLLDKILPQNLK